jgi:hypothetical protein
MVFVPARVLEVDCCDLYPDNPADAGSMIGWDRYVGSGGA